MWAATKRKGNVLRRVLEKGTALRNERHTPFAA